ncbi:A/G-specific adenine DNA glycosylase [Fasciolopsis buskii]|uniref:Adenine DNA glycosylase n=1 Tax=Fasciolopsis buskii TaxID=27845 RepID=A0A8E0S0I0_9TREM|nr:A/G-specific adenine DNA glycosylase [Fasciolopsis buski]
MTTELSARAFFYSQRVPVLDGNVIRVLTRVRRIGAPIQLATTNTLLWELADHLVDPKRPGDFNQSLMELGAILCTPKQPSCSVCPLGAIEACMAYTETWLQLLASFVLICSLGVTNFPVKLSKRPQREETTVVIVVHALRCGNPHFLLFQRPKKGLLAGLWEFPGETVTVSSEPSSKTTELQDKARLSVMNRIKSAVKNIRADTDNLKSIGQIVHLFSHIRMTYDIHVLNCEFLDEPDFGRWVSAAEFADSPVSTAARKVKSL